MYSMAAGAHKANWCLFHYRGPLEVGSHKLTLLLDFYRVHKVLVQLLLVGILTVNSDISKLCCNRTASGRADFQRATAILLYILQTILLKLTFSRGLIFKSIAQLLTQF